MLKMKSGSKFPLMWQTFWIFVAIVLLSRCANASVSLHQLQKHHNGRSVKLHQNRHTSIKNGVFMATGGRLGYSKSMRRFLDGSSKLQVVADDPNIEEDGKEDTWGDYLNALFDPEFDPAASSNVSAVVGHIAHLPCRVNHLGTKTVSWIRHHDTHILTVGSLTYTGDNRFSALHREGTNEWTLQIRVPTLNDSGLYECQVSTRPVRAYLVRLDVVVPATHILHAPDLHTNEGGVLNLTCIVSPSPAPPEYIFWYHKNEVINYETDQRVVVNLHQEGDQTISSLVISPAGLNHSGTYACEPSNAKLATIIVHVSKAEEPAAMQTSSGRPSIQATLFLFYPIFLLIDCIPKENYYFLSSMLALSSIIVCLTEASFIVI